LAIFAVKVFSVFLETEAKDFNRKGRQEKAAKNAKASNQLN
jgi:hypothetical protein